MPDLRACADRTPEQDARNGDLRTLRLPYSTETQVRCLITDPGRTGAKGARAMDASHFVVGGLTAVSLSLLVWIEVRSRRKAIQNATELNIGANDRPAANARKDER